MDRNYNNSERPDSSSRIPMRPGNDQDERVIKEESPVSDLKSARKLVDEDKSEKIKTS